MSNIVMTLAVPDKTGASRMAWQFSHALIKAGHRVVVAHGREPDGVDRSIVPMLKSIGVETIFEPGLSFPVNPMLPKRLARLASRNNAHCLIGVNQRDRAVALSVSRRLSVPGVICAQNQHTFWGPWPLPLLKEAYYARSMQKDAALIICTSAPVQEEFVKRYGVHAERTCCLSNGIDVRGFPRFSESELRETRQSMGFGDDDVMLTNVGRIDPQKGLDILVEAIRLIDQSIPARLIQIGDVTDGAARGRGLAYRQKLQQMICSSRLENRISFIGWREDVPRLLQSTDIYVHSARWEGSPLSVIEAMAAGIAVVTPDNTSRPEGFEDGVHGIVVAPESPQALAEGLNRMLRMSKSQRCTLGLAARSLAESRYDIAAISEKFVSLIEGVISRIGRAVAVDDVKG